MSLLSELGQDKHALPPEIEEGNVEYKLKLIEPSPCRLQNLITQMKWRLSEGAGEALYELGVSDGGELIGMTDDELAQSLATMRTMAHSLGAEISVLRMRQVCGTARRRSEIYRELRDNNRLLAKAKSGSVDDGSAALSSSRASLASQPTTTTAATNQLQHLPDLFLLGFTWFDDGSNTSDSDSDDADATGEKPSGTSTTEQYKVAEVLVRKITDSQHFLEVRVAFLGTTDAGKSSLLGLLAHGELDNGRGKARLNLLRHRHEIKSGRSSSISHSVLGFDSAGLLINHSTVPRSPGTAPDDNIPTSSSPSNTPREMFVTAEDQFPSADATARAETRSSLEGQIVDRASKIVMLLDTPGHKKFFSTTLQGLTGYNPDYACLVVDGLAGTVDATTKEVLGCALVLAVPTFVCVTKIDLAVQSEHAKQRLRSTIKALIKVLMLPGSNRVPVVVQNADQAVTTAQNFVKSRVTPIFLCSAVSGQNTELLLTFLNLLPTREALLAENQAPKSPISEQSDELAIEFQIEETYNVPNVGVVAGGRMISGRVFDDCGKVRGLVSSNPPLFVGPMDSQHGKFVPIRVTSIERQRRPVKSLRAGQSGTLALSGVGRNELRRGMVILSSVQNAVPEAHLEFEAEMCILFAPENAAAAINCPSDAVGAVLDEFSRKRRSSAVLSPDRETAHDIHQQPVTSTITIARRSPERLYRPRWGFLHLGSVHQPALIMNMKPLESESQAVPSPAPSTVKIVTGARYLVHFRFARNMEFIKSGSRLLYREGSAHSSRSSSSSGAQGIKMVGQVVRVFDTTPTKS